MLEVLCLVTQNITSKNQKWRFVLGVLHIIFSNVDYGSLNTKINVLSFFYVICRFDSFERILTCTYAPQKRFSEKLDEYYIYFGIII